jgi:hypothetical protein
MASTRYPPQPKLIAPIPPPAAGHSGHGPDKAEDRRRDQREHRGDDRSGHVVSPTTPATALESEVDRKKGRADHVSNGHGQQQYSPGDNGGHVDEIDAAITRPAHQGHGNQQDGKHGRDRRTPGRDQIRQLEPSIHRRRYPTASERSRRRRCSWSSPSESTARDREFLDVR